MKYEENHNLIKLKKHLLEKYGINNEKLINECSTYALAIGYDIVRNDIDKDINKQGKRVAQIDIKTGKIIKIWPSTSYVADKLSLNRGNIGNVANGKRSTHGGYSWKFI